MKNRWIRCLLLAGAMVTMLAATGCQTLMGSHDPWERLEGKFHTAVTPVSKEGGWMRRHEAMNARVAQGNVDLIFVGDSITQGWEVRGKDVWARYYAPRNAVNLGISGDRTQHVLWRLDHGNIDGIQPKLAVVMIGTNNLPTVRNTPEEATDGVYAVVRKLHEKLPETKILLLSIFPRADEKGGPDIDSEIGQVNREIEKLCRVRGIETLNINGLLTPSGEVNREIFPDLLHPSEAGYEIWAEAIEPHVKRLMGE